LDLAVRVAQERQRTLEQLFMGFQEQQEVLLASLKGGGSELSGLLEKVERAGMVLRDTAQSLERLAGPEEPGEAREEEVSGRASVDMTLGNISTTATQLNLLVKNIETLAGGETFAVLLDEVDGRMRAHEYRVFLYAGALMALFFVLLMTTLVTVNMLKKRHRLDADTVR
jgi:hypothetical protein